MRVHCELSQRQIELVLAGGLLNWMRARFDGAAKVFAPELPERPGRHGPRGAAGHV